MKKTASLVLLLIFSFVFTQIPDAQLDQLIKNTRETFDVPGISVGIIKDGKIVYQKGHGVASLKTGKPMNSETLVGIASNSKGFTGTALAILADEGKLNWDDKVTKFIPEFKMYDPYVTKEITVKDLVTHRAGLGLGQGDLMFFPDGGTLTIQDIIHNVQYLKPEHGFREKMDYNNIMFIVAGEVITRISGQSWAEFVEERILKPVGMTNSYGSYNRAAKVSNKIDAHAPVNGKAVMIPHDWNETANAAGGIMSNIPDMLTWAECMINGFKTKDGKKLVSDKQIQQLLQIQQPITVPASLKAQYDTNFYGYGLGWFLSDVKGHQQIQHTGGLLGTVTQFTVIPDLKLGIVVLTNQQSGAAFNSITNAVKDSYLGIADRNWLKTYDDRMGKMFANFEKGKQDEYAKAALFQKDKKAQIDFSKVAGTYSDPWFGDVDLIKEGKKMRIMSRSSLRLKGDLIPYSADTYIVKWDDRSYDADAFVTFTFDSNGKAQSIKMKPISDITDFSFDFDDLDLQRKK